MIRLLRPALAALLLVPSAAHAEEPSHEPPTGTPWLVGGGIAMASGVLNLSGAPLCLATLPHAQQLPCAGTSIAFGIAGLAIGAPLVVVGIEHRAVRRLWLDRVTVRSEHAGATIIFRGAF